jgi:hypothetical protein
MDLSPSLHQKFAVSVDFDKSFGYIPVRQPIVRHYPGSLTLVTQCDPRLGARSNDVDMRRTMIV